MEANPRLICSSCWPRKAIETLRTARPPSIPRVPYPITDEWVAACRGESNALSNFAMPRPDRGALGRESRVCELQGHSWDARNNAWWTARSRPIIRPKMREAGRCDLADTRAKEDERPASRVGVALEKSDARPTRSSSSMRAPVQHAEVIHIGDVSSTPASLEGSCACRKDNAKQVILRTTTERRSHAVDAGLADQ